MKDAKMSKISRREPLPNRLVDASYEAVPKKYKLSKECALEVHEVIHKLTYWDAHRDNKGQISRKSTLGLHQDLDINQSVIEGELEKLCAKYKLTNSQYTHLCVYFTFEFASHFGDIEIDDLFDMLADRRLQGEIVQRFMAHAEEQKNGSKAKRRKGKSNSYEIPSGLDVIGGEHDRAFTAQLDAAGVV